MTDYPTVHMNTNESKRTTCSKKWYRCKWTWQTIQQYTWTQIRVKEQLVVRNDVDVNEHERLSNRLLDSLMFIYIHTLSYYKLFLYFNLSSSVLLDSLSCSFTLISVQVYCWIVSHVHLHPYPFLLQKEHERLSNSTLELKLK
jgi:hypothetical protein